MVKCKYIYIILLFSLISIFLYYLQIRADKAVRHGQELIRANMSISKVKCTGVQNRTNGRYREITFSFELRGEKCEAYALAPNKEQNAAPFIGKYFPIVHTKDGDVLHCVITESSEINFFRISIPQGEFKAWLDNLPPLN